MRLLGLCGQWRCKVENDAVQLAHAAATPAGPIAYWILKYLEKEDEPVEFPCSRVELHIPTLQDASKHARTACVSAALQTVHSRHFAPNSLVRLLYIRYEFYCIK